MEELAPFIFATMLFVVVPVVFMLLKHQQKMAELIHRREQDPQTPVNHDQMMLLHEISRLRDVVAQQSIAIDNLAASQRKLESQITPTEDVARRLIGN